MTCHVSSQSFKFTEVFKIKISRFIDFSCYSHLMMIQKRDFNNLKRKDFHIHGMQTFQYTFHSIRCSTVQSDATCGLKELKIFLFTASKFSQA